MCETRDDKGNAVLYEYKPEDGAGVDLTHVHERNRGDRDDPRRNANRFLKRIRYGNRAPLLDDAGAWNYRDDPFSSYRAGFDPLLACPPPHLLRSRQGHPEGAPMPIPRERV